jgi:hypothetical protein
LYAFLKKVEAMKTLLGDNQTILLIPGKSELFNMFVEPPKQEKAPKKGTDDKVAPPKGARQKADRFDEFNKIWQQELAGMLRKMRDEGRLKVLLDDPGDQGLDIPLPKK